MSTVAFKSLSFAEQTFKDLVWTPMIKAGEMWLESNVPVLALPVIKQLDEASLGVITDYVFNQLCFFIDVTAIKLVNAAHQTAFDNASLQLKIVAQESGPNSTEFQNAKAAAISALSAFTNLTP